MWLVITLVLYIVIYRGQAGFVGNEARKILKKAPKSLQEMVNKELVGEMADKAGLYLIAFFQLDLVVEACFGQDLDMTYTDKIKDFMRTYRKLGISIPLKVRICLDFKLISFSSPSLVASVQ